MTPLRIAALEGRKYIVRHLLDTQKKLDLEAGSGGAYGTALWAATHRNHVGIVKLLLEHGACSEARGFKLSEDDSWRLRHERSHFDFGSLKHRFIIEDEQNVFGGLGHRGWGSYDPDPDQWKLGEECTPLEEAMVLNFAEIVEVLQCSSITTKLETHTTLGTTLLSQ